MPELQNQEEATQSQYAPKQMSAQENILLTIKVLAIVAAFIGVIWLGTNAFGN